MEKINSGDSDELDVDIDWPKIEGVKEGLHHYDIEKINSGRIK